MVTQEYERYCYKCGSGVVLYKGSYICIKCGLYQDKEN